MDLTDALSPSTKNTETGRRLKEAREKRGWTQKELAEAAGVVQPFISKLETGAKLTEKQGRKLSEILEVGFDWLMEGDERNKYFPVAEKRPGQFLYNGIDLASLRFDESPLG